MNARQTAAMALVIVVLMVVGTFWDLPIAAALYNPESAFALICDALGELPCLFCAWIGAALLWVSADEASPKQKALRRALAVVAMVASTLRLNELPVLLPPGLGIATIVLVLLLASASFAWVLRSADRSDKDAVARVGAALALVFIVSFVIVGLLKFGWARPRYSSLLVTEGLDFQPWYVVGSTMRDSFSDVLSHEAFRSFPSGHVTGAACLYALMLLPAVIPSLRGKERAIMVGATVWTALVMVGRLISGEHFLTDVVVGLAITVAVLAVFTRVFVGGGRERRNATPGLHSMPESCEASLRTNQGSWIKTRVTTVFGFERVSCAGPCGVSAELLNGYHVVYPTRPKGYR